MALNKRQKVCQEKTCTSSIIDKKTQAKAGNDKATAAPMVLGQIDVFSRQKNQGTLPQTRKIKDTSAKTIPASSMCGGKGHQPVPVGYSSS